jgi:hypothetical protein
MTWRALIISALCFGLLGCGSPLAFPARWDFTARAVRVTTPVAARELTPRTRRTETVTERSVTFEVVIQTAEVEAAGVRGLAPVSVRVTPTRVEPGLRAHLNAVNELELSSTDATFSQRIEVSLYDAKGDEKQRMLLITTATGAPGVAPLRAWGQ